MPPPTLNSEEPAMGLAPHFLRAFFFDLSRAHALEEATERF